MRQPRQLARRRVLVHDAFGDRPVQLRLRQLQRQLGGGFIAAGDRRLDLLDEGANPAHPRAVDCSALFGLANTLFRRFAIGHVLILELSIPAFYLPVAGASIENPTPRRPHRSLPARGSRRGGRQGRGMSQIAPLPSAVFRELSDV